jgi:hypothetical protein
MVIYTCQTCNKEFNKKSNFISHTENKKKPCAPFVKINQNLPKLTKINQKSQNLAQKISKSENNDVSNISNYCNYCNKIFTNIYTLKRHLDNRCKVKKDDEENKKNIFELLIEKEKLEKENLKNEMNELKKKLEDLITSII